MHAAVHPDHRRLSARSALLERRKEVRLNLEYIYDHHSPIGYTAVPQTVGGTGSILDANLEMSF